MSKQVADMRTLCVGVAEKPTNPRLIADKWLGEIGYAISVSTCSGLPIPSLELSHNP